jgi:hypothetical protein
LLQIATKYDDEKLGFLTPVNRAIADGDFEAFVQIAELCKFLPKPILLVNVVHESVLLSQDRVEILDEYIRRTGTGIHLPEKRVAKETGASERPKGKEYWGLNVHGKKRKDLAIPNAPGELDMIGPIPLVWKAVQTFAPAILTYLASERPLAAYRYYFATNTSDKRARNMSDLAEILPEKLGWCANGTNETPLVAAVIRNSLDAVKHLFILRPKLMKEYLQSTYSIISFYGCTGSLHPLFRSTWSGYNLFLRAVYGNCSVEFIDYLIENGVSVTHFDHRG